MQAQLDTALTNANTNPPPMEPHPSLHHNRVGSSNEVIDVYSLYETIMDDDSELQDGYESGTGGRGGRHRTAVRPGGVGNRGKRHKNNCCHSFCKCLKCSFLIAFVLIICVGLLVILPLKIIFSDDQFNYNISR